MATHELEVALTLDDTGYDPDDRGWQQQRAALYRALKAADVDIRQESQPVEGSKGLAAEVILSLGSAGAVSAAVTVIQAWLSRERRRRVRYTFKDGDREISHTVEGSMASDNAIKDVMLAALEKSRDNA